MIQKAKIDYIFASANTTVETISMVLIYLFIGVELISGKVTMGSFLAMLSYFNNITSSLVYYSNILKEYKANEASYKRLSEYLSEESERIGEGSLSNQIESIETKGLSLHDEETVIDNLSLTINKGLTLIKGDNGSGKTSLGRACNRSLSK